MAKGKKVKHISLQFSKYIDSMYPSKTKDDNYDDLEKERGNRS
jgi:hypothetical protein